MQVRGNSLRGVVAAARRLYGQPILEKATSLLPAELASRVQRDSIVTGSWYPLDDLRHLDHAVMKAVGRGPVVVREVAREAILDDFRGIYKVLAFVLSPEFIIKRTPGIWRRYYSGGDVKIDARSGAALASFTDCATFDEVMWQGVIGGISGVLESCGARELDVKIVKGGHDDDHLTINATWR